MFRAITAIFAALALLAVLAPSAALAQQDQGGLGQGQQCDSGILPADVHLDGPAFLSDQTVHMRGSASDLFAFAQYINIPGEVQDNTFAFGQKINVRGVIEGDLFAFCQNLSIEGEVGGDVWLYGGELYLAPGACIGGNVMSGCGMVILDGRVDGSLKLGAGTLTINGELGKGGDVSVGLLTLGPGSRVRGELVYECSREAAVDSSAIVAGNLVFHQIQGGEGKGAAKIEEKEGMSLFDVLSWLWKLVAGFLVGAAFLLAAGKVARRPSELLGRHAGKSLGIGFLVFVATPVAALVAIALLVTLPLGLVTLSFYGVAVYLAGIVASLWLGAWLLSRFGRPMAFGYLALIVGLLVFNLLKLIPYLGWIIALAAAVAGLGGIFLTLIGRNGKPVEEPA